MAYDDMLIRVQSEWNGWRNAEVRLADLRDVHWFQPHGAHHPFLHGYIVCSNIATGEIPHDCDGSSAPHRLRVCALKRHTIPSIYAELARRADEQRWWPTGAAAAGSVRRPSTPAASTER